ncbi:phage virion morphogenesis protein [Sphingomonas sp. PR090111-T3T-6A]|uniref:phage virion morphogenesis protein n=1 Tax=Sphingomonas sp. PR090111-T3T-6A TaxID=685778 RepID=UPI000366B64F|nr:phage virion morphogenesis protein [Sphingomonas sp. PR090111-T3T-6A]
MEADLAELEKVLQTMIDGLAPGQRRRATRMIAAELRRSQSDRIAAQLNPDGSPFEPRKPRKKGVGGRAAARARASVSRKAMFAKLRTSRFLKARSDADSVEVGFAGRAAQIARVHQEGLRDKVDAKRSSAEATYPIRRILGLTGDDRQRALDVVASLLGG